MERILIIGAAGQIGSELTMALREIYGNDSVYATDIKEAPEDVKNSGPIELLDVMDDKRLIHFLMILNSMCLTFMVTYYLIT